MIELEMPLRFPLGGYTKAANDTYAQLESGHWFCSQKESSRTFQFGNCAGRRALELR